MGHVVLVGDSIFDNARYTEGGPLKGQRQTSAPTMKSWLRLTLITMTVGGGFAGFAATFYSLFWLQVREFSLRRSESSFLRCTYTSPLAV